MYIRIRLESDNYIEIFQLNTNRINQYSGLNRSLDFFYLNEATESNVYLTIESYQSMQNNTL